MQKQLDPTLKCNFVAIVQARIGSTRLPGKVLMEIEGKPMLEHVIERLKRAKTLDEIIIATSNGEQDKSIIELAKSLGIKYFVGSESDVLDRYLRAAERSKADVVVRVTADCPLIDPSTIDKVVRSHINSGADYTSNTLTRSYPRGLDVEVFNIDGLRRIHKLASERHHREHVTPYFYEHPDMFKLQNIEAEGALRRPELRLCVDVEEDMMLIKEIYKALYRADKILDINDVIHFLNKNPELIEINAKVKQKRPDE